jgi:hypothetical protein
VYLHGLDAGEHTIEITLRGKPGGQLSVLIVEEPGSARGVGFEILDDGTVLHRKTGLIWHRNPNTPGYAGVHDSWGLIYRSEFDAYLTAFNAGTYGTDPVEGNAGHSDWREPTMNELVSLVDYRFGNPSISDMNGGGLVQPLPLGGWQGGMKFGQPFFICPIPLDEMPTTCTQEQLDRFWVEEHGTVSLFQTYITEEFHLTIHFETGLSTWRRSAGSVPYLWLIRDTDGQ